jgi:hypothetical protein
MIVHLILTSEAGLRRRYGDDGWQEIDEAISRLGQMRRKRGLVSLLLDPAHGWPAVGIAGVPLEPAQIAEFLAQVDACLHQQQDRIASLLILGDAAILPFAEIADPVPDNDRVVPTDWLYGQADSDSWLAHWPVGRLPDRLEARPATLCTLLANAAAAHQAGAGPPVRGLGVSAESWYHVTRQVLASSAARFDLIVVPPEPRAADWPARLATAGLIYCNLHGLKADPDWYGHAAGGELMRALQPADLRTAVLPASIVFSQACYGAALPPAAVADVLALAFLRAGALAFLASTALSYGSFELPISDSDLLAQQFLLALDGTLSIGESFQQARRATVRMALLAQGFLDDDDRKVLQSFVLYGDPTLPAPALLRSSATMEHETMR